MHLGSRFYRNHGDWLVSFSQARMHPNNPNNQQDYRLLHCFIQVSRATAWSSQQAPENVANLLSSLMPGPLVELLFCNLWHAQRSHVRTPCLRVWILLSKNPEGEQTMESEVEWHTRKRIITMHNFKNVLGNIPSPHWQCILCNLKLLYLVYPWYIPGI